MSSIFDISTLHTKNYNIRNVLTRAIICGDKHYAPKMPCIVNKYTLQQDFISYKDKSNEWFKEKLVIQDTCGYGIKCGRQMNGKFIICLDFDIYDPTSQKDCEKCKKCYDDYSDICGSEDGMYSSSTEGNYNVLCDITDCNELIELAEERGVETFKPIVGCGLEFQITKHQVIPPTATPCKKTGRIDVRREYGVGCNAFKIVEHNDDVCLYLERLLKINTKKPYVAGINNAVGKSVDSLEQYKDMLMNGLNFHMEDYTDYLKITGVMKTNGFDKELFCEWVATTNPKDDSHLELWDSPCKYEKMSLGVLNNICKEVNPEFYKTWYAKWFVSKFIPYNTIVKGVGELSQFLVPHLTNKLVYCNEQFYECDSRTKLWYLVKEPTHTLSKLIGECLDYTTMSLSKKVSATEDEDEKDVIRKEREVYSARYIKWRDKSSMALLKDNLRFLLRDNNFVKKLDSKAGQFVFKNGILDLRTDVFKEGIEPEDFLTFTTSHNYDKDPKKRDTLKEKYVIDILKKVCNNCEEDLEYLLSVIGYALTGCSSLEKSLWYLIDGTEGALGDNGKSLIFAFLTETIPEYVKKTTAGFLELKNTKVHKQLVGMKGKRIVWADEGTTNKVNDELLKVIPDGRTIENEVMFGTTEIIEITFKLFCCSNNKTNIGEGQNAVFNRYNEIPFKSHFDRSGERIEEDESKLLFVAEVGLGDKLIADYCDSFFNILMDYAKRYFKTGLAPKSVAVLKATNQAKMANDTFITWFNDTFEVGTGFTCSSMAIEEIKPEYFKNLADIRKFNKTMKEKVGYIFNKDLTGFGTYLKWDKSNNQNVVTHIKGGFSGFRIPLEEE